MNSLINECKLFSGYEIRTKVLREKCPYWEFFWFAFSRIQTKYGEIRNISPYSVLMRENTNQKNSQYGYFSRSEGHIRNLTPNNVNIS